MESHFLPYCYLFVIDFCVESVLFMFCILFILVILVDISNVDERSVGTVVEVGMAGSRKS